MKKLLLFCGVMLILPMYSLCQSNEYLTTKAFQLEKKQLLESVYRLKKSTQELQKHLSRQNNILDSLSRVLTDQRDRLATQQDSLLKLKATQTNFDSRLSTQRKSGTLMVILIPAILFLFILIMLVLFLRFRQKIHLGLKSLEDEAQKTLKKLEDHMAAYRLDQAAIQEQLNSTVRKLESTIDSLSGEVKLKFEKLEKLQQDEKVAHDTKHLEAHQEVQAFREELQKGYQSISEEVVKLKQELATSVKDLHARMKEIQEEKPEK
ncbi:MAG: hypothetical protein V1733_08320 [bacterium]